MNCPPFSESEEVPVEQGAENNEQDAAAAQVQFKKSVRDFLQARQRSRIDKKDGAFQGQQPTERADEDRPGCSPVVIGKAAKRAGREHRQGKGQAAVRLVSQSGKELNPLPGPEQVGQPQYRHDDAEDGFNGGFHRHCMFYL